MFSFGKHGGKNAIERITRARRIDNIDQFGRFVVCTLVVTNQGAALAQCDDDILHATLQQDLCSFDCVLNILDFDFG